MRIESPNFTAQDLAGFLNELDESDRLALADRLERASARLGEVAARLPAAPPRQSGEAWSALEVLAHIAVLSKFYGMLTYKIGKGEMTELDLVGNVGLRDVLGEQLSRLPAAELVDMARADQARTVAYLRSADGAALRRQCSTGGGLSMAAGEVARLPLCAHLEQHLRQLEDTLGPG
jgi:hypothetical protein